MNSGVGNIINEIADKLFQIEQEQALEQHEGFLNNHH